MDFGESTIRNPFAKQDSSKPAPSIDLSNLWGAKTLPEFHFGTGKVFTSYSPQGKKFTDVDIVNKIDPNQKISLPISSTEGTTSEGPDQIENAAVVMAETGEEDDEVLFDSKCNLYVHHTGSDTGYSNIGCGPFHLNKHADFHRVTMRREPLFQVVLNSRCSSVNNPQIAGKSGNLVRFAAIREDTPEKKMCVFAAKFRDKETAEKLVQLWQSAIKPANT